MLIDLRDKLQPIGRLDVLDDVAEKAKAYLSKLPKDQVTAQRLREQSVMLDDLGDVLVAQGKLAGALDNYQSSLRIRKFLTDHNPSNLDWQRDLAVSDNKVGDTFASQGRLNEALEKYRVALDICRHLTQQ